MRTNWVAMAVGVALAVVVSVAAVRPVTPDQLASARMDESINQSHWGGQVGSWRDPRSALQQWWERAFPPPKPVRLIGGIL